MSEVGKVRSPVVTDHRGVRLVRRDVILLPLLIWFSGGSSGPQHTLTVCHSQARCLVVLTVFF